MFTTNANAALFAGVRLIFFFGFFGLFGKIQSKLRVLVGPGYVDGHDLAILLFLKNWIDDL